MTAAPGYTGRFAPSPTGPLHFGSLVAAAASYLQARVAGGRWLVRMEDIDPPREQPGAGELIVAALRIYGFEWDGDVILQSRRRAAHLDAIERLGRDGLAYACTCSRRDLEDCPPGTLGPVYPGTCRAGAGRDLPHAIRVRTDRAPVAFIDALQGPQQQCLEEDSGDFIIHRRDGLVAYQLAVVVDDAIDGITEVVRGADLLTSTPRQIYLQRLLGLPTPGYLHVPVVTNAAGQKLSKQSGAPPLDLADPRPTLVSALETLAIPVATDLAACSISDIWAHGTANWRPESLRGANVPGAAPDPLAGTENGLS